MTIEIECIEEHPEEEEFICPYCGSHQGYELEPVKTETGHLVRDYWCELCDAPPGEPAFDERLCGVIYG
jgi:hypothetical protein